MVSRWRKDIVQDAGYRVQCRRHLDVTFRLADHISSIPGCGLSLFRVRQREGFENESYTYVPLDCPLTLTMQCGEKVYSHIHGGHDRENHDNATSYARTAPFSFSFVWARVAYPYPKSVGYPNLQEIEGNAWEMRWNALGGDRRFHNYRCVASVVDRINPDFPDDTTDVDPFLCELSLNLPLIQVSGFHPLTYFGQCGCPVFKSRNQQLVGLIMFAKDDSQFICPIEVMRDFFVKCCKSENMKLPLTNLPHSSDEPSTSSHGNQGGRRKQPRRPERMGGSIDREMLEKAPCAEA